MANDRSSPEQAHSLSEGAGFSTLYDLYNEQQEINKRFENILLDSETGNVQEDEAKQEFAQAVFTRSFVVDRLKHKKALEVMVNYTVDYLKEVRAERNYSLGVSGAEHDLQEINLSSRRLYDAKASFSEESMALKEKIGKTYRLTEEQKEAIDRGWKTYNMELVKQVIEASELKGKTRFSIRDRERKEAEILQPDIKSTLRKLEVYSNRIDEHQERIERRSGLFIKEIEKLHSSELDRTAIDIVQTKRQEVEKSLPLSEGEFKAVLQNSTSYGEALLASVTSARKKRLENIIAYEKTLKHMEKERIIQAVDQKTRQNLEQRKILPEEKDIDKGFDIEF